MNSTGCSIKYDFDMPVGYPVVRFSYTNAINYNNFVLITKPCQIADIKKPC